MNRPTQSVLITLAGVAALALCVPTGPLDAHADPAASPSVAAKTSAAATGSAKPSASAAAPPKPSKPSASASASASKHTGLLHVSGVSSRHRPSLNPFSGSLEVSVTLRNASTATLDASVQFWADSVFGNRLGNLVEVPVVDLAPEETRTISASVGPMAQWTLVSAHANVIPPGRIGPTQLHPMPREQWVFFVPWALLAVVLAVVGAVVYGPRLLAAPRPAQERAAGATR